MRSPLVSSSQGHYLYLKSPMAKSTLFLTVTTFMCIVFLANAIPGGRTKIKDVKNNQEVQELGRYCVEENNRKVGSNGLKFVEVVKAESQVVSGTKYYLTIKAIRYGFLNQSSRLNELLLLNLHQ